MCTINCKFNVTLISPIKFQALQFTNCALGGDICSTFVPCNDNCVAVRTGKIIIKIILESINERKVCFFMLFCKSNFICSKVLRTAIRFPPSKTFCGCKNSPKGDYFSEI